MTGPASHGGQLAGELPSMKQLCAAAMKCFAVNGIEAGSLREVARIAGVSVGFVQNRFGSKSALVDAVNQQLVAVLTEVSASPTPGRDPAGEWTQRAMVLIEDHPDAVDYLGQLLLGDHPTGSAVFDELLAICTTHCRGDRAERTGTAAVVDDVGSRWDPVIPLVLMLGMLILRSHIERHSPEPLASLDHRRRWESALDNLLECPPREHSAPRVPR